MANEATIRTSLMIKKGNIFYQSNPTAFKANVTGTKGPVPGAVSIAATVTGTDIDFSELVTPGLCRLQNLDATNFVTYGIWDGVSFFPLGELLPGETYVLRLSRYLGEEFAGTGTPADVNTFRMKADTAACNVLVEAFEQ